MWKWRRCSHVNQTECTSGKRFAATRASHNLQHITYGQSSNGSTSIYKIHLNFFQIQNKTNVNWKILASHADVLRGSSRVPAQRTSAETNNHFRSSANCLCLNRPISIDSLWQVEPITYCETTEIITRGDIFASGRAYTIEIFPSTTPCIFFSDFTERSGMNSKICQFVYLVFHKIYKRRNHNNNQWPAASRIEL